MFLSCSRKIKEAGNSSIKSEIHYAKHLEILKKNGNVLIHIKNPETHQIEKKYLIQRSSRNQLPEGYMLLKAPLHSMITLSSTHIGMLSKLHATNLVVGISNHVYVHNSVVLNNYRLGKVLEMGEEGDIPVESIVHLKSDVLIYSGFGKSFPYEEQIEKLGTICLVNYDWREVHPLGKAEWIKLFGYLIGKEKQANRYFKHIEKEYKRLKKMAKKATSSPTLFSGNLVGDTWFSPAGESYNAILFNDAKGKYCYANTKGTGSIEKSFEQTLKDNQTTQFWLNPGFSSKKLLLKSEPKVIYFESFKVNNMYCYSFSGNEFWERSCIEPHHVLSDLIQILHPELKMKKVRYFYRKLTE